MVGFCDSPVLSLSENILNHVVYFDFAKAFDSVNHGILLKKLNDMYKIDRNLFKFIENYLEGRFHKVVIGSESSSTLNVNSVVPQGSIIGPLLFLLFTNDLPSLLSDGADNVLYADDTKIWRKINWIYINRILIT
jgi:retron-type reverse transcriptase